MPMLYGEGERAFARLQEEIIKKYNDLSILAWKGKSTVQGDFLPLLAPTPANYIRLPRESNSSRVAAQFSLTNQGLIIPKAWLYMQQSRSSFRHHYILLTFHARATSKCSTGRLVCPSSESRPGLFVRLEETSARKNWQFETAPLRNLSPSLYALSITQHLKLPSSLSCGSAMQCAFDGRLGLTMGGSIGTYVHLNCEPIGI